MQQRELPDQIAAHVADLFTRAYQSAANYAVESQPYQEPADEALLAALDEVRADDRRHALLLANLLKYFDRVPESGVFPYWYRDLNYMTVPFIASFVADTIQDDVDRYDRAMADTPDDLRIVHTTLRTIRAEREKRLAAIAPAVLEGCAREAVQYAESAAAIAATRSERLAQEKAAAEAVRKAQREAKAKAKAAAAPAAAPAADPTAGLPDPSEPGISSKEKAKRTMMIKRAQKKAAAAAPAVADPAAGLPDPNEPGITSKEKAKRTMMIKRAQKKAAAAAPAVADPAVGLPDPNEEGISSKEKAKRTMMIKRAQKKAAAAAAEPLPAAPAAAAVEDPAAGMPDPNEEGLSSKEKAKRTMMIKRAQKKAAAAAASAPAPAAAPAAAAVEDPAAGMPDPDEEGISSKEKAKRTMMIRRARKNAQEKAQE